MLKSEQTGWLAHLQGQMFGRHEIVREDNNSLTSSQEEQWTLRDGEIDASLMLIVDILGISSLLSQSCFYGRCFL